MSDNVSSYILAGIVLPILLYALTRPSKNAGQSRDPLVWINIIGWVVVGIVVVWLIKNQVWPILRWW